MAFNATFQQYSVISWRSVLSVEETGENNRPASHRQTLSHNVSEYEIENHLIYIVYYSYGLSFQ
jgi:hypothetical protein